MKGVKIPERIQEGDVIGIASPSHRNGRTL